jgi:hypothetical protein
MPVFGYISAWHGSHGKFQEKWQILIKVSHYFHRAFFNQIIKPTNALFFTTFVVAFLSPHPTRVSEPYSFIIRGYHLQMVTPDDGTVRF